jgi:hypothetical protein
MAIWDRDSEAERWLAVLLRSLHLASVVALGAQVMGAAINPHAAPALVMGTGLVMLVMDLRARRISLRELAGAAVLVKLALVAWMAMDAAHALWIFWLLVLGSAVTSHAPKHFRHWPTPPPKGPRQRISSAPAGPQDPDSRPA